MNEPQQPTGLPEAESIHECEHCKKAVRFGDTALSTNLEIICDDCNEKEREAMNEQEATEPSKVIRLGDHIQFSYTASEVLDSVAKNGFRHPCPFCGDTATGFSYNEGDEVIVCLNCGATGPRMRQKSGNWNEDDFRTLALWNARMTPLKVAELKGQSMHEHQS